MSKPPLIQPESVTVNHKDTLHQALKVLDTSVARIALVLDDDKNIIGSVVDGDVRRGLLRGATLDGPATAVMRKNPFVLPDTTPRQQLLEAMRTHDIRQIPLVNEKGHLEGVVVYDMLAEIKRPVRSNQVVIMAGGKGRRLFPLTTDMPKPMVQVGGRPMLEWIIMRLTHYGFRNFTLAINYLGHMIEDHFGDGKSFDCNITYLKEDLFLGTAGALSLIKNTPSEPMLVMNGDILTTVDFEALLDTHILSGAVATVCARSHQTEVPFGVIKQQNNKLMGIDEKPVYENLISAGMYAISPQVLDHIPKDKVSDMPGVLMNLVRQGEHVGVFSMNEEWLDVGRHDDLDRAKQHFTAAAGA